MVGYPKFKHGDLVFFEFNNNVYTGQIIIIDAYGVFEDNTEVYYDIYVYDTVKFGNVGLCKHVPEYNISKKIGYKSELLLQ